MCDSLKSILFAGLYLDEKNVVEVLDVHDGGHVLARVQRQVGEQLLVCGDQRLDGRRRLELAGQSVVQRTFRTEAQQQICSGVFGGKKSCY